MNANNPQNVNVGKPKVGGSVFMAPSGTALPTNATTPLPASFHNVGYISEAGITNEIETDSEEIKAWGGDVVLSPQTSRSEKFKFAMIETNETSLTLVYGEENVSVSGDGSIRILHNGLEREEHVFVIETLMQGGRVKRQVVPRGKLTEIGEIAYKDDEVTSYDATISALLDSSGNTAYEYIAAITGSTGTTGATGATS